MNKVTKKDLQDKLNLLNRLMREHEEPFQIVGGKTVHNTGTFVLESGDSYVLARVVNNSGGLKVLTQVKTATTMYQVLCAYVAGILLASDRG